MKTTDLIFCTRLKIISRGKEGRTGSSQSCGFINNIVNRIDFYPTWIKIPIPTVIQAYLNVLF